MQKGGRGTVAVYVKAEHVDLGGGNHVIRCHCYGAIALAKASNSVGDVLEAGLPGALNAEGDLVAARASYRKAVMENQESARGVTYTASTQMVHWIGLSFMALCVAQEV